MSCSLCDARPNGDGVALQSITLSDLTSGQLVEVVTEDATYWVARIAGSAVQGDWVIGLMIQTDNNAACRLPVSPVEMSGSNAIRVGTSWRYGRREKTTLVRSIRRV
jgi:hypothetical protein